MNAQIKKGILETCILYIIGESGSIYGYDLIKKMADYFPEVNESTFYAILRRMHKNNFTAVFLQDSPAGPQRKYYKITKEGEACLHDNIEEWKSLVQIMNMVGIE